MFARAITFSGAQNIDAGIANLQDHVVPILHQQKGFQGITASVDRSNGVMGILTFWETSEDREASMSALAQSRDEGHSIVGGEIAVENFEQTVLEVNELPVVGSALMVNKTSMDPAKVEENLAFFKSDVVPRILATPGVQVVRSMMNRDTGHGMVGIVFSDRDAMTAAAGEANRRREEATARGVHFDDVSFREIVLADFR